MKHYLLLSTGNILEFEGDDMELKHLSDEDGFITIPEGVLYTSNRIPSQHVASTVVKEFIVIDTAIVAMWDKME